MKLQNRDVGLKSIQKSGSELYLCPECRAPMVEAERITEPSGIYIWFQCSQPVCSGAWLQKIDKISQAS